MSVGIAELVCVLLLVKTITRDQAKVERFLSSEPDWSMLIHPRTLTIVMGCEAEWPVLRSVVMFSKPPALRGNANVIPKRQRYAKTPALYRNANVTWKRQRYTETPALCRKRFYHLPSARIEV